MCFEKRQEALHKSIDAKLKLLLELQEIQASAVLSGKQEIMMNEKYFSFIEGMIGSCSSVSVSTEGNRSQTSSNDILGKNSYICKGAQYASDKMVTISSDQLMSITNNLLQKIYDDQDLLQQMRASLNSKNLDSLSISQPEKTPQIEQNQMASILPSLMMDQNRIHYQNLDKSSETACPQPKVSLDSLNQNEKVLHSHTTYYGQNPQKGKELSVQLPKRNAVANDKVTFVDDWKRQKGDHVTTDISETLLSVSKSLLNTSLQKQAEKSTSLEQSGHARNMVTKSSTSSSFFPLGLELDDSRLSKFLTFVRNEMIGIIEATDQDVKDRSTSKKVMKYQVGIRCRFCAHLPFECRAGRSANFPSSIQRLYQGVSMIIYRHFPACKEIPDETREKYEALREYTKKGDVESQSYWISSAKMKGMVDTGSGILLTSRLKSNAV